MTLPYYVTTEFLLKTVKEAPRRDNVILAYAVGLLTAAGPPEGTHCHLCTVWPQCSSGLKWKGGNLDWPQVNAAIVERWSKTALVRIKEAAHGVAEAFAGIPRVEV